MTWLWWTLIIVVTLGLALGAMSFFAGKRKKDDADGDREARDPFQNGADRAPRHAASYDQEAEAPATVANPYAPLAGSSAGAAASGPAASGPAPMDAAPMDAVPSAAPAGGSAHEDGGPGAGAVATGMAGAGAVGYAAQSDEPGAEPEQSTASPGTGFVPEPGDTGASGELPAEGSVHEGSTGLAPGSTESPEATAPDAGVAVEQPDDLPTAGEDTAAEMGSDAGGPGAGAVATGAAGVAGAGAVGHAAAESKDGSGEQPDASAYDAGATAEPSGDVVAEPAETGTSLDPAANADASPADDGSVVGGSVAGGAASQGAASQGTAPQDAASQGAASQGAGTPMIKGDEDVMVYHTPQSPYYAKTEAEMWFKTEEAARRAGFTAWNEPR